MTSALQEPPRRTPPQEEAPDLPGLQVAVVTGSRSDYGLLRPLCRRLADAGRLQLIVTGMHLEADAGFTVDAIAEDGIPIAAQVPLHAATDRPADHARAIGTGVTAMVDALESVRPDVVVVLGDRYEILAASIAATYSGRVLAHIHGGDVSAGHDEATRHAITKMAHIHLPATDTSAARILAMGEAPWRIEVVGAPGLEAILHGALPDAATCREAAGLPEGDFVLFAMHPISTDPDAAASSIHDALVATKELGMPVVAVGNNLDPGGRASKDALRTHQDTVHYHESLPHEVYLGLLRDAWAMVGNSSSALIEAAAFGTPAINIGDRQAGRERGPNVQDVADDAVAVRDALRRLQGDRDTWARADHPFGDGRVSRRIVEALDALVPRADILQKRWHDPAPAAGDTDDATGRAPSRSPP